MQPAQFSGFPPASLTFLRKLARNNNRAWFAEHRAEYEKLIVEPSRAFVAAMGAQLEKRFPHISYDTRMNGSGSMMRIARDTRFSSDKTPYRSELGFFFWEGVGHKRNCPGIFIRVTPNGAGVYAGKWMFPDEMLKRYRAAVEGEKSGKALMRLVKGMQARHGLQVGGARYKRVPKGYALDHPRAEWLKNKGLRVEVDTFGTDILSSKSLVTHCASAAGRAAPLHRWLVDLGIKS